MIDLESLQRPSRPLIGARAAGYPFSGRDSFVSQHRAHIDRTKRHIDLVHAYAGPGRVPFEGYDLDDVADWAHVRGNPVVVHNWKPTRGRWRNIDDDHIENAAQAVAALDPTPVMLILHHEPENDTDAARKSTGKGWGGSGDYRFMWQTVRDHFDTTHVHNVVWACAFMNYPKWDSAVAELYPGDDLVDWIMFNAYGSPQRPDFAENVTRFIELLDQADIGDGKPLGIAEWGINAGADGADYYRQAADFLDTVWAERIKSYMVFDSPGHENASGLRLGYDQHGHPIDAKQAAYRAFARHSVFDGCARPA